jgi:hypothetical protein
MRALALRTMNTACYCGLHTHFAGVQLRISLLNYFTLISGSFACKLTGDAEFLVFLLGHHCQEGRAARRVPTRFHLARRSTGSQLS